MIVSDDSEPLGSTAATWTTLGRAASPGRAVIADTVARKYLNSTVVSHSLGSWTSWELILSLNEGENGLCRAQLAMFRLPSLTMNLVSCCFWADWLTLRRMHNAAGLAGMDV